MTDTIPAGGIQQLLTQALEQVALLHDSLRDEHAALTSNQLGSFESAVEKKLKHTARLEQIEQAMFNLLKSDGYRWNKQGFADYVSSLGSSVEHQHILQLWPDLRQLIGKCQLQNQINGRILNLASVNIRQALDILTGHDHHSRIYRADGKPDSDNKTSIAVA